MVYMLDFLPGKRTSIASGGQINFSGGSRISQMGMGHQLLSVGQTLLFSKISAENYMEMNEIGPRGGTGP